MSTQFPGIFAPRYIKLHAPLFNSPEDDEQWNAYDENSITLIDSDGFMLFETDYESLLNKIIEYHDVAALTQYLAKYPSILNPNSSEQYDVFFRAASKGAVEILRLLLRHYDAHRTDVISLNDRPFVLLNVACMFAKLDIVCFLLNDYAAYASIHARGAAGLTAIRSTAILDCSRADHHASQRQNLASGEELMHLLLDRGACAGDVATLSSQQIDLEDTDQQLYQTVLSAAIAWASPELVKQLIIEGADVCKKTYASVCTIQTFGPKASSIRDIMSIFLGSLYLNVKGI
ncbi:hypothetical protein PT974_07252 [Cladobotryum mycophilum]|uniref:Uncharacterized protein n=1 Tax=Cladobotryum mycophilum TaxID=491253 RepID=A0ABR0SQ21_9HYPO